MSLERQWSAWFYRDNNEKVHTEECSVWSFHFAYAVWEPQTAVLPPVLLFVLTHLFYVSTHDDQLNPQGAESTLTSQKDFTGKKLVVWNLAADFSGEKVILVQVEWCSVTAVAQWVMRGRPQAGSRQGPSCRPRPSENPWPIVRNGWHAGCSGPGRGHIAAHAKHSLNTQQQCMQRCYLSSMPLPFRQTCTPAPIYNLSRNCLLLW